MNTTPNNPTKNRTIVSAPAGRHGIEVTREFDTPRELVFKAFTDPNLWAPALLVRIPG